MKLHAKHSINMGDKTLNKVAILEVAEGEEYLFTTPEIAARFICDNYKHFDLKLDSYITIYKCELDKPETKKVVTTRTIQQFIDIHKA